jgi:hypothetical protein
MCTDHQPHLPRDLNGTSVAPMVKPFNPWRPLKKAHHVTFNY